MVNKIKALYSDKRLVIVCYIGFFVLSILAGVFSFAQDRLMRANGTLQQTTYTIQNFELYGLEEIQGETNALISTNIDPRMIMLNAPERVHRVDIYVNFSMKPGEFNVFYMPQQGMEEFDPNYRQWAQEEEQGHYSFALPRKPLYGIRIDPGIYTGNEIRFAQIVFNQKMPITSFFSISYTWLFYFALVPAMGASAIKYVIALFTPKAPKKEVVK